MIRVAGAGWPTLREFLEGTKAGLTVGMYDFTAPHIRAAGYGATHSNHNHSVFRLNRIRGDDGVGYCFG